jgi:hypothetical protein
VTPRREWPLAAALVLLLANGGAAAGLTPRVLADFDEVGGGRPGGEAFARPPSTATARRIPEGDGHALEVAGRQVPAGLAGVRVTFYDAGVARPTFVDASRYDYLTFRIRATGDPSRLQLKLADAAGAARDEGIDAGEVTRYLPQGLSTVWRQVAIPLGALGVNRRSLAALTLVVVDPAVFTIAIDDVALKRDPEDALPPPRRRRGVP